MSHKEFVGNIATKLEMPKDDVEKMVGITVSVLSEQLSAGGNIGLQGFGTFEVRKKEERIAVHPVTRARTLIPPKLAVNFKQSNVLKEKLKELPHEQN